MDWDDIVSTLLIIFVVFVIIWATVGTVIGVGVLVCKPTADIINQKFGTNYTAWQCFCSGETIKQTVGLERQPQPAKINAEVTLKK